MAKQTLELEEIIREFIGFLNENGLFLEFEEFIEQKGYSLEEFGMNED